MPFVNIRILKGHSQERKDEMSRRITAAISELAQLPNEAIWVVFEDITADDWYVGATRVSELQKAAAGPSRSRPQVLPCWSGSCAPRWCFPPRFNHRLEQLAQRHHRTFGPSATRARCKHSRVPQGTLTKYSRFAQRRLLHDFMPSQIATDGLL